MIAKTLLMNENLFLILLVHITMKMIELGEKWLMLLSLILVSLFESILMMVKIENHMKVD